MARKATVQKNVSHNLTMPSGMEIMYESEPDRHYEIRVPVEDMENTNALMSEWERCDFSMSEVADVLSKEGLVHWGQEIGVTGAFTLLKEGYIVPAEGETEWGYAVMGETQWEEANYPSVKQRMKMNKLTVNQQKNKAGDRGNSVHAALEDWIENGVLPDPKLYPDTERGYVEGLLKFLADLGEMKSKPESEVMVGSYKHRIAGRFDFLGVLHGARLCTKLATDSWKEVLAEGEKNHHSAKPAEYTVFNGRTLLDLKTSSGIYTAQKLQVRGYGGCFEECGLTEPKNFLVVRVTDDGRYVVGDCSDVTFDDFLAVLDTHRRIKRIEGKS